MDELRQKGAVAPRRHARVVVQRVLGEEVRARRGAGCTTYSPRHMR